MLFVFDLGVRLVRFDKENKQIVSRRQRCPAATVAPIANTNDLYSTLKAALAADVINPISSEVNFGFNVQYALSCIYPFDDKWSDTFPQPLSMKLSQQKAHQKLLFSIISQNTVKHWASSFIKGAHRGWANTYLLDNLIVPGKILKQKLLLSFNNSFTTFNTGGIDSSGNGSGNPNNTSRIIIVSLFDGLVSARKGDVGLEQYSQLQMIRIQRKIKEAIRRLHNKENNTYVAILSMHLHISLIDYVMIYIVYNTLKMVILLKITRIMIPIIILIIILAIITGIQAVMKIIMLVQLIMLSVMSMQFGKD